MAVDQGVVDGGLLVAWFVMVFWQVASRAGSGREDRAWYERARREARCACGRGRCWVTPPGWLFGIAWAALYVAIWLSCFALFRTVFAPAAFTTALALAIANLVLNKAWSQYFWDRESPPTACGLLPQDVSSVIAALMLLTSGAVFVLALVAVQDAGVRVLVCVTYGLYSAWTGFALLLNLSFARFARAEYRARVRAPRV